MKKKFLNKFLLENESEPKQEKKLDLPEKLLSKDILRKKRNQSDLKTRHLINLDNTIDINLQKKIKNISSGLESLKNTDISDTSSFEKWYDKFFDATSDVLTGLAMENKKAVRRFKEYGKFIKDSYNSDDDSTFKNNLSGAISEFCKNLDPVPLAIFSTTQTIKAGVALTENTWHTWTNFIDSLTTPLSNKLDELKLLPDWVKGDANYWIEKCSKSINIAKHVYIAINNSYQLLKNIDEEAFSKPELKKITDDLNYSVKILADMYKNNWKSEQTILINRKIAEAKFKRWRNETNENKQVEESGQKEEFKVQISDMMNNILKSADSKNEYFNKQTSASDLLKNPDKFNNEMKLLETQINEISKKSQSSANGKNAEIIQKLSNQFKELQEAQNVFFKNFENKNFKDKFLNKNIIKNLISEIEKKESSTKSISSDDITTSFKDYLKTDQDLDQEIIDTAFEGNDGQIDDKMVIREYKLTDAYINFIKLILFKINEETEQLLNSDQNEGKDSNYLLNIFEGVYTLIKKEPLTAIKSDTFQTFLSNINNFQQLQGFQSNQNQIISKNDIIVGMYSRKSSAEIIIKAIKYLLLTAQKKEKITIDYLKSFEKIFFEHSSFITHLILISNYNMENFDEQGQYITNNNVKKNLFFIYEIDISNFYLQFFDYNNLDVSLKILDYMIELPKKVNEEDTDSKAILDDEDIDADIKKDYSSMHKNVFEFDVFDLKDFVDSKSQNINIDITFKTKEKELNLKKQLEIEQFEFDNRQVTNKNEYSNNPDITLSDLFDNPKSRFLLNFLKK